jgi:hypothetical protein
MYSILVIIITIEIVVIIQNPTHPITDILEVIFLALFEHVEVIS